MVGVPIHLVAGGTSIGGPSILAHQGGWDEILMVVGPIIVIVVVLRLVKRRIDAPDDVSSP